MLLPNVLVHVARAHARRQRGFLANGILHGMFKKIHAVDYNRWIMTISIIIYKH